MNPHQDRARWKKAGAIADLFEALARREGKFDAERPEHWAAVIRTAEQTSQADWRALSVMAGQRPASEETQKLVVEILRGREQAAGVDPFAGMERLH